MPKTVASLNIQEKFHISYVEDNVLEQRLLSMGILPGAPIFVVRKAPIGGSLYLKIGSLNIAVRKEEAANIFVE